MENTAIYKIYDRLTDSLVPCEKEFYEEYTREITRIRKSEQYHQRCFCPKQFIWQCDGCCEECRFHAAEEISLDAENKEAEGNLYDVLPNGEKLIEDQLAEKETLQLLYEKLCALDPAGNAIWQLFSEGLSDRRIGEKLGRSHSTFGAQMQRYRRELKKILEK